MQKICFSYQCKNAGKQTDLYRSLIPLHIITGIDACPVYISSTVANCPERDTHLLNWMACEDKNESMQATYTREIKKRVNVTRQC